MEDLPILTNAPGNAPKTPEGPKPRETKLAALEWSLFAMPPHILRLAYVSEFLLAVLAIQDLWAETGGHLEFMPWYTKLSLVMGLALTAVMGTVSAVSHDNAWNPRTLACVALAVLIAGGMAAASYYYHLHENDDQDSSGDDSVALCYSRDGMRA